MGLAMASWVRERATCNSLCKTGKEFKSRSGVIAMSTAGEAFNAELCYYCGRVIMVETDDPPFTSPGSLQTRRLADSQF